MNCFKKQRSLITVLLTIIIHSSKIISTTTQFNTNDTHEEKNNTCKILTQKNSLEFKQTVPTEFIGFAQGDPDYAHESFIVQNEKGQVVEAKGFAVSVFYDIATSIQCRPIIKKGSGWGEILGNGSWTGIPSQVLDPQYDVCDNVLSITLSILTLERAAVFTFLQPTYSNNYFVYFRSPASTEFRNVFVQPFESQIWQSIFLVSIISAIILKVMFYCNGNGDNKGRGFNTDSCNFKPVVSDSIRTDGNFTDIDTDTSTGKGTDSSARSTSTGNISDLFLWIVANLCQRGWTLKPISNSMRTLLFCFALTTTVLYIAYSATLVSIFSSNAVIKISDLSQLSSKGITIYTDAAVPFISQIIQASMSKSKSKTQFEDGSNISNNARMNIKLSDAVTKVWTSKSAIVTLEGFYDEFQRENLSLQEYCDNINTIKISQPRRLAGMYVRKGWKYKEIFGKTTILIIERGLNFRYNQVSNRITSPFCGVSSYSKNLHLKIDIKDAITAFVLLASGMGISFVYIIFENTIYYLRFLLHKKKEAKN